MRKILIITAAILAAVFFFSCGLNKPVEVYRESFIDVQKAEPQYLYMQSMLPSEAKLIRWEEGFLMEKAALVPGAKWKKRRSFTPEGLVIKKQDSNGINMIPVKYIEGWSQDLSGIYSAFTLKLGPSMNSSVAFFSFDTGSILYNHTVTDRPKDPPAIMSISIKDTFFSPKVSDDARYFAVVRYNYLNTSYVRVYENGKWDKFEETDNAGSPCFASGALYCRQFDRQTKKTWLVSREFGGKAKRIHEIKDNLLKVDSSAGRVFIVTVNGISEYTPSDGKVAELFNYSQLKAESQDFEIADVYFTSDKQGPIVFLVNKKKENGEYVWRLSARRL